MIETRPLESFGLDSEYSTGRYIGRMTMVVVSGTRTLTELIQYQPAVLPYE